MDACRNERHLQQGIGVPENISRAIPGCVFPYDTGSPARNQRKEKKKKEKNEKKRKRKVYAGLGPRALRK
eukprot:1158525-Pelagomonas_calceolata.AAC.2